MNSLSNLASLLLGASLLATLVGCGDSATPQATGSAAGLPCQTTADCQASLLCIGRVCRDPNDRTGNNGGITNNGGIANNGDIANNVVITNNGPTNNIGNNGSGVCTDASDQDGDGVADGEEGGEDPDHDGLPNCLDNDSDNDGLLDAEERRASTDPYDVDTDGDRVNDLLEWAAGTDARNAAEAPPPGTLLVVVNEGVDTRKIDVEFSTDVQRSDIYVLMDTSTTMDQEIENLKRSLVNQIMPGVRDAIPDVAFGVGHYDDFDQSPYGNNAAFRAYENLQSITQDDQLVVAAINQLHTCCAIGDGATYPEAGTVALWATATGEGLGAWFPAGQTCGGKGGFGYPCFRPGALPVIIVVTDALFHNGPNGSNPYQGVTPAPPGFDDAMTALNDIGAKVVGVVSEYGGRHDRADVEAAARRTGAVNDAQQPLVYEVDGSGNGLDGSIVTAIEELTGNVSRDVHVVATDPDEDDPVDPTDFVTSIVPRSANPLNGVQGEDEQRFYGVVPGTLLTFEATFVRNGIAAGADHQVIHLVFEVLGDGTVLLDEIQVYLVIARRGATIGLE